MKMILLATSFLLSVASSTHAADIGAIDSPAYDWSGAYVGGAVGYSKLQAEDLTYGDGRKSDGGLGAAIYGGYNHQIGNWVFGAEADLKFSKPEVDDQDYLRPLEARLAGSLRARAGYSLGAVLPYLTGGLAIGGFRADHNGDGSNFATETLTGYVVGGGIEWAATQRIIVRAEYLFSDYGQNEFGFNGGSDIHDIDVQTHDIRLGVAYKF